MYISTRRYGAITSAIIFLFSPANVFAVQTFSLSFDTVSLTDPNDLHVYSEFEREAIRDTLSEIYHSDPNDPGGGPFGIKFEIFDPNDPPIPFATSLIKFNNGFMGGVAEKLDFRNLDDNDDVDVNALGLLRSYVGAPKAGGGTWTLPELTTSENLILASANLAAHEAGHSMGLRHHDSFGPMTTGIAVAGTKYSPTYIGPTLTTNASFHVMGLASTVALSPENLLSPSWLSERSALKLMHNTSGPIAPEVAGMHGDPNSAQPIPLAPIPVPNTHRLPDPLFVDPVDPTPLTEFMGFSGGIAGATLDVPFALDYYVFDAPAGSIVTIEVISKVIADTDPNRIPDPVDMSVEIIDATLSPLPYPVAVPYALNDDSFESTDSILFDVVLTGTAPYFLDIRASGKGGADITGEYEVYVAGIIPPGPPENFGNFDLDKKVDGVDFLKWQRGESFDPYSRADFDAWEMHYGLTAPISAATETVPEPTTCTLALTALCLLVRRLR